jgi:hypothetical protein
MRNNYTINMESLSLSLRDSRARWAPFFFPIGGGPSSSPPAGFHGLQ